MNNYIFYHCTPINDYYERFLKTFNKIKTSGLLDEVENLFVCLNGDTEQDFLLHEKVQILQISKNHPNESVTVNYIRDFCKKNQGSKILYLHSKGVTKPPHEIPKVNAWVDFMEFFLIENYHECLKDLSKDFDAVGVNLKLEPRHFSGNFWWASGDYISSLEECADTYYAPEMWHLSKCSNNRIKSYFNTNKNLYHEIINKEEYQMELNQIKSYILDQGSDSLYHFGGKYEGGIFLQQNPTEISEILNFLIKTDKDFEFMLEVGSASGANAKVFCEILKIKELFIVDDNQHGRHNLRPENLKNIKYQEFIGNSQGEEAYNWVKQFNKKFDIIYIDADHSYQGVMNDIKNYTPFLADNGYMVFHDSLACEGVSKALKNISKFGMQEIFSSKETLGITICSKQ